MSLTQEQIAKLRRLLEAANRVSPVSDWAEDGFNDRSGGESYRQSTVVGAVRPYSPPGLDMYGVLVDTCNADSSLSPDDRYDLGAFIAAIANAAAALLSAAEENARLREALRHCADGIVHARELGRDWSPQQAQAWLNGLELKARKTLAALEPSHD